MSRYGDGHKEQTHSRILDAAGRLFRRSGYLASSVDTVMEKAGLTIGGFYKHFSSKEGLFIETIAHVFAETRKAFFEGTEELQGSRWLGKMLNRYLSEYHRDKIAEGCLMPALSAEVALSGKKVRKAFEREFLTMTGEFGKHLASAELKGITSEEYSLALASSLVGAVLLSRAVQDPQLSKKLLNSTRKFATAIIGDVASLPVPPTNMARGV